MALELDAELAKSLEDVSKTTPPGDLNWVLVCAKKGSSVLHKVAEGHESLPELLAWFDNHVYSDSYAEHPVVFGILRLSFGTGRFRRECLVFICATNSDMGKGELEAPTAAVGKTKSIAEQIGDDDDDDDVEVMGKQRSSAAADVSAATIGRLLGQRATVEKLLHQYGKYRITHDVTCTEDLGVDRVIDRIKPKIIVDADPGKSDITAAAFWEALDDDRKRRGKGPIKRTGTCSASVMGALSAGLDDGEEGDDPEDAEFFGRSGATGELSPVDSEVEEELDPALQAEIEEEARKMTERSIRLVLKVQRWKRRGLRGKEPAFDPPSRAGEGAAAEVEEERDGDGGAEGDDEDGDKEGEEEGGDGEAVARAAAVLKVVPKLKGLLKKRRALLKGTTQKDLDAGDEKPAEEAEEEKISVLRQLEPSKPAPLRGLILKQANNFFSQWQTRCFVVEAGRMQYFTTAKEEKSGKPRVEYDLLGASVLAVDNKEQDQFEVFLRGSKRKGYLFKADIRMFTKKGGESRKMGFSRADWVGAFADHIAYAKSFAAYQVAAGCALDA